MNFVSFVLVFSHSIFANSDIETKIMKLRFCASAGNCGDIHRTILDSNDGQKWSSTGHRSSLAHRRWMSYHRDNADEVMERAPISPKIQTNDLILQFLAQKAKTCSVPCQRKPLLIKWVHWQYHNFGQSPQSLGPRQSVYESNDRFRKETVLQILSSDGQKPKIDIMGMEDDYLDIGYCAGACRHSNSVSRYS